MAEPRGKRVRVVGHRGAAAIAPENTLASFRAGVEAGADAVEIDVQLSSDGHLVLLHDHMLDRTTSGRGDVRSWTWEALRRLDAGSWFSSGFAGERIPDLDEAIAAVRGRSSLVVEIKARADSGEESPSPADLDTADAVLAALDRSGGFDRVTLSCAHWSLLASIASRRPRPKLALTLSWKHDEDPVAAAVRIGAVELHPPRMASTPAFVGRAHSAGLEVLPYTVNKPGELRRVLAAGADGVFTDDPGAIRRLLEKTKGRP